MKKKILSIGLILMMVASLFALTGCGNKAEDNKEKAAEQKAAEEKFSIDNNNCYYVKINGTKFKAGDKISSVSSVGLKQKEKNLATSIPKNRYLLAESVVDSNEKEICKFVPLNDTDDKITVADAVIGGFEVGTYNYNKIAKETLEYDIEIFGGIKLGSSYEDMVKVFGEPDFKHESQANESLKMEAYTTYKYSKGYKGLEFIVDDSGKISQIEWNNYDYNE